MKAIWNGTVIAESDDTIVIEGNHYFPSKSVKEEYLKDSTSETVCPWKGVAHYKNIVIDGETNYDGAWYYPHPKEAAERITGYYAFWRGVEIEE